MKKYYIIALCFGLIISFQNCSQNPASNSAGGSGTAAQTKYNQVSTEDYNQLTLWDYTNSQSLELDLSSGQMVSYQQTPQGEQQGNTYCLTASDLQQVKSILAGAQICEPIVDPSTVGQVCAEVYTYPYASLVITSPQSEIKLGEKINACDQPTDLCGTAATDLKNFVMTTLANLSSKTCSN